MGLVLDSTVLISAERKRRSARDLIQALIQDHGDQPAIISAISVIELTHGIYRAQTEVDRQRRSVFASDLFREIAVQPVTLEIAQRAGQIEGEQAALGNVLPFEDLIIGATALVLNFAILTHNLRHFRRIPGASVLEA